MAELIDLARVRRALADLERTAADHPEAFHPERLGLLIDHLEDYMTPSKNRMKVHRDRLKAQGKKRITVTLSQEAAQALEALKAAGYGRDYNAIVTTALLRLAIAAVTPRAALVDSAKDHGQETGQ